MFIAFTNLGKLMSVGRSVELGKAVSLKCLSTRNENHEFLILFPDGNWVTYKNLPANFIQAVAIISFDYNEETEDELPKDLTKLLESKYEPYCLVLYHSNQNERINKLLKNHNFKIKGIHQRGDVEYEIVIDLVLDAPKEGLSNAQFVHEKTKELRKSFCNSAISSLHTQLIRQNPPTELPEIFSAFDAEYQTFLKEINGQFDANSSRHRKLFDELKTLLQEDEYRA